MEIKAEYPLILIDDELRDGNTRQSNWDCDVRGADGESCKKPYGRQIKSVNTLYPTCLKRNINVQKDGKITLETDLTVVSGSGLYIGFWDGETEAVKLIHRDGFFTACGKKVFAFPFGSHHLKLTADIDRGIAVVYVDGKWASQFNFTGSAERISSFRMGFSKEDTGEAYIGLNLKLTKGYIVCDPCVSAIEGDLPQEYRLETESGKAKAIYRRYSAYRAQYLVYDITAQKDSDAKVVRDFERASGNVSFEIKYLAPEKGAKTKLSLSSSGKSVITLCDDGENLKYGDAILYTHSLSVWQTLNVEADTDTKTAVISLNGKTVTNIAFESEADYIDSFGIGLEAQKKSSLLFADAYVFVKPPYPADYVPEPIVPEKKGDCYVGINVCPIWHGGHHYGWDEITPFKDNRPYLGYYDEGIPEVADWEIKWMSEHGIDFELYCWYAGQPDAPMIRTPWSSAIHNGHMKARYSDKVKIALLWEASAGAHPASREAFRKYFVPYFIDYFFRDSRYMTIDGTAIMSIFAPLCLVKDFGSAEAVREEFSYLRSEVKKLGYKDLAIMCCSENVPEAEMCGVDAVHAYNWGRLGYDPDRTKDFILKDAEAGYVHAVPTVSMGYNVVAWNKGRSPCMKPEDMKMLLEWCRDEILPRYKDEEEAWKRKLIMLSTWNEYGEGTYMMPAEIHGFGYLDAVRSVFTKDPPHTDTVPGEEQIKRINVMHPIGRKTILPLEEIKTPETGKVYKRFTFKTKADLDMWEFHGISDIKIKNGILYGHSDRPDPYMMLKDEYLPFEASKASCIRAHIRSYKPVNKTCCIQAYYSVTSDKKLSTYPLACLTDPDRIAQLDLDISHLKPAPWKDDITAFRFDPIWAEGDFELKDIELLAAPEHKDLVIDGKTLILAQYLQDIDGKTYLPFDTRSELMNLPSLYYEWHDSERALYLFGKKDAVLHEGSDRARLNGEEITLPAPLTLYDGMPLIEIELFADIFGYEIKTDKKKVYLTSEI